MCHVMTLVSLWPAGEISLFEVERYPLTVAAASLVYRRLRKASVHYNQGVIPRTWRAAVPLWVGGIAVSKVCLRGYEKFSLIKGEILSDL